MQRDHDEDAWRAIVENYGDRVELDDEPPVVAPQRHERPEPPPPAPPEHPELVEDPEDAFVPPPPPPLPKLPPDRLAAWSGLIGAPALLLVCLVVGIGIPAWAGYLLVAAFIGGFAYLVITMPRGPADPYDDGARL